MPEWPHILLVLAAYLIGGISPGYWLAKRASGVDLRNTGSGATGATNAGRVLGKRGFYIVVALDILKGGLVAIVACFVMHDVPLAWQFAASLAVVAGHIWSIWLGFRGGKGVATFYGAWTPLLDGRGFIPAVICIVLCLVLKFVFKRSFKTSWLAVHALFPVIIWWLCGDIPATLISTAMILLIWIAHRENIAAVFSKKSATAQNQQ